MKNRHLLPHLLPVVWLLAVLLVSCGKSDDAPKPPASAPTPEPQSATPPEKAAPVPEKSLYYTMKAPPEDHLIALIQKEYNEKGKQNLQVSSKGALPLPETCTVDIQYGSGHGFYLSFLRLSVNGDNVQLEHAIWSQDRRNGSHGKEDRLYRAKANRETLSPFLKMLALLPHLQLEEIQTPAKKASTGKETPIGLNDLDTIGSSTNIFVLVRIVDAQGTPLYEGQYAGYKSTGVDEGYLPLLAAKRESDNLIDGHARWVDLPDEHLRNSHFTDALKQNRNLLHGEFHGWVLEYALRAAAIFANGDAIETLKYLKNEYPSYESREQACTDDTDGVGTLPCFVSPMREAQKKHHNAVRGKLFGLMDMLITKEQLYLNGPPASLP